MEEEDNKIDDSPCEEVQGSVALPSSDMDSEVRFSFTITLFDP